MQFASSLLLAGCMVAVALAVPVPDGALSTAAPPESTTAIQAANSTASPANATCKAMAPCLMDADCAEGGSCLGLFIGTCNCNACLNFLPCSSDAQCGGLEGGCVSGFCKCWDALSTHGYASILDALNGFCNKKNCVDTTACNGLPCHKGFCGCPATTTTKAPLTSTAAPTTAAPLTSTAAPTTAAPKI